MNWGMVFFLLFLFLLLIIFGFVVILYIKHWSTRSVGEGNRLESGNVYFIRYLSDKIALPNLGGSNRPNKINYSYHFFNILVVSSLFAFFTIIIVDNKSKIMKYIDLTNHDISILKKELHNWDKVSQQKTPDFFKEVETQRNSGIILLTDDNDVDWVVDGKNPHSIALYKWDKFIKKNRIDYRACDWKTLVECENKNNSTYLILPGTWHLDKIQKLLSQGRSLLFYGFPRQIYNLNNEGYSLAELSFQRTSYLPTRDKLSLVGDKELTLGFDAGLILNVQPDFPVYKASSLNPQAVSMSEKQYIGSQSSTRLYSKSTKEGGRLVWMDFSPNKEDHSLDLHQQYFDSLLASILRYLNKETYESIATWPSNLKFAAILEEDTEDKFENAKRVAKYFQEKNYPITWYMLSNEAQAHRDVTLLLSETGEVACHGDNHQAFTLNDPDQQHIRLARCKKVLEELTGKTVQSFRPPEEKHNEATLSAIANTGFKHFIAKNSTDRFVPIYYKNLSGDEAILSIPRMNSDDYLLWNGYKKNELDSVDLLNKEVDQVERIGGLFTFSFHTQYMSNDAHFNTVTQLADYINDKNAYFTTASDLADWWLVRNKLLIGQFPSEDDYKKFSPRCLKVDTEGVLNTVDITECTNKRNIDIVLK